MSDDELNRRVLEALAQSLKNCDTTQRYNVLEILGAVTDALKHKKDLSPFARYARTFEAGCPHTEVA